MSIKAINWVRKLKNITPSAKFVLFMLANYANNENISWPSHVTLSKDSCYSIATIKRSLKYLINNGYISIIDRENLGGKKSSVRYKLNVFYSEMEGVTVKGVTVNPVHTDHEGGHSAPNGGQGDPLTNKNHNESLLPSSTPKKIKRKSVVAENYKPSESVKTDLVNKYPSLNIDNEIQAFIDFHISKGTLFLDFDRALRTWCRNAIKFNPPKKTKSMEEEDKSIAWVDEQMRISEL